MAVMSQSEHDALYRAATRVAGLTSNARCDEHRDTDPDDPVASEAAESCEDCVRYTQHVIYLGLKAMGKIGA